MKDITNTRLIYKPFEYPQAEDFFIRQQQAHWLWTEVPMTSDIQDFHLRLSSTEREIISKILKLFTQTEVMVNEYWGSRVVGWFPKPEIVMMASTFAAFEAIHQASYSYLNDSLGVDDYAAFLDDKTMSAKIDALVDVPGKNKQEIMKSLAIFSAFVEGVALFSSFAVLMSFSLRNLLKGVGQIVAFSCRDEALHSEAGCWLFREMVIENPELLTDDFKRDIYQAARDIVQMEDNYIDSVFESGGLENLDKDDLKEFIRYRANVKLGELGFKKNWEELDMDKVLNVTHWFDVMTGGVEHQDFFAQRVTSYSKSTADFDSIWS